MKCPSCPASVTPSRCGLTKLGFRITREGKHTVMSNGRVRLVTPRHNQINAFTMAAIARDAGLTPEQFRELI